MQIHVLTKLATRVRRPWRVRQLQSLLDVDDMGLVKLGSPHGGWIVPTSAVHSGGTAVCVGAGEDITFDVELNKRGFNVFTVDPTPRAKEHVVHVLEAAKVGNSMAIDNSESEFYDLQGFDKHRFTFADVGVWNQNTAMRFFAPKNQNDVSHSIVNLQSTAAWFEAKCVTLRTFCDFHKIGQIDILKLDIEGSEYAVLRNIMKKGPWPKVLCVEFDEIRNPIDSSLMDRIQSTLDLLGESGYRFRHIENSNALFVRQS
jgi:FkbM family methyltransferase